MWNRILGTIGMVWGAGILISALIRGGPQGRGAYLAGQYVGFAMAAVMFMAGLYAFTNSSKPKVAAPLEGAPSPTPESQEQGKKKCPHCGQDVSVYAVKCRHCKAEIVSTQEPSA